MFKKGIALIVTVVFTLMLSTAVFAGIQLNPVENGNIILIEPQIGTEKQVFVKESLAISIRSDEDYPANVSLYKVMPSARSSFLESACDSEMVVSAKEIPFRVISGSSIIAKDAVVGIESSDEVPLKRLDETNVIDDNSQPDNIIDGTEALLQKEKLSLKDRQSVINTFNDAREEFEIQLEELEGKYEAYSEMFEDVHAIDHEYTDDEMKVIKAYLIAVEKVKDACAKYRESRDTYEAIFEVPLFGPEDLTDTGILPYYQKTVEKISPGMYKFVFSKQVSNEILDVVEFEISKKEELTEEDIKDAMPTTLGTLILPAIEEEKIETDLNSDKKTETRPDEKTDKKNEKEDKTPIEDEDEPEDNIEENIDEEGSTNEMSDRKEKNTER